MDVLGLPAADTFDEIREMVAGSRSRRAGLDMLRQPRLVRVIAVNAQIAVRSIEEVADSIRLCINRPDRPNAGQWIGSSLGGWSAESGGRHTTALVNPTPDLRLMIRDPGPNFEFHHLAFAVRTIKVIGSVQHIGSFLIVVEEEMAAHRGDHGRKAYSETPARDVDFVNGLIADFAIAGIPDPMPVVVKAIPREWLQRRWAGPQVVMNAVRHF